MIHRWLHRKKSPQTHFSSLETNKKAEKIVSEENFPFAILSAGEKSHRQVEETVSILLTCNFLHFSFNLTQRKSFLFFFHQRLATNEWRHYFMVRNARTMVFRFSTRICFLLRVFFFSRLGTEWKNPKKSFYFGRSLA